MASVAVVLEAVAVEAEAEFREIARSWARPLKSLADRTKAPLESSKTQLKALLALSCTRLVRRFLSIATTLLLWERHQRTGAYLRSALRIALRATERQAMLLDQRRRFWDLRLHNTVRKLIFMYLD